MALYLNTNISSLNAQSNLSKASSALATSLQRLSSGLQINSAADNAAGYAVSTNLTSQINGDNQAIQNANDGSSLAQVADGALGSITNDLQRLNQLAVQSANGTITDGDRSQLQDEADQLTQEISRTVQTANFNGVTLLSGTNTLTFQVGSSGAANNQLTVSTKDLTAATGSGGLYAYNSSLTATGTVDITTQSAASADIANIAADLTTITNLRSTFGAVQNRFTDVVSGLTSTVTNLSAANSQIVDTNYASETAKYTQNQILVQAGTAILAQSNSLPQSVLTLLR